MADLSSPHPSEPFEIAGFPSALLPVAAALAAAGHSAFWLGSSLLRLLEGRPSRSFGLRTNASEAELTALFTSAVPLANGRGSVMIPNPAGPVDATPYRHGGDIVDELAHQDFTIHAVAYDASGHELFDPFGGLADLTAGRLRSVGSAHARISADPLCVLRAARLIATHGLKIDPELELASVGTGRRLDGIARIRIREELVAILLAPGVAEAWRLIEHSGISRVLAPQTPSGAGALIEKMPCELEPRLAAWLRGPRPRRALQRLRFSRRIVDRVERLLQLHPIEQLVDASRWSAVAKLSRRESARDLDASISLRRAEIQLDGPEEPGVEASLETLEQALAQVREQEAHQREKLAFDGAQVMETLGCAPGPEVGRALAYLRERVANEPALNDTARLRELLRGWQPNRTD